MSFDNVLSEDQKFELDTMPDDDEYVFALQNIKENKSPGLDGLPIEFYKCFWKILEGHYKSMINEAYEIGMLPYSTKTSVLSLLFKTENKKILENYRPLSLANYDYKILAFIFAQRIQNVMPSIIHPDQTACIKGRYIGCNVRNIIDLYDYIEENNLPGALLCIDFRKAFDMVEHNFLFSVLKRLNFGDNFIRWLQTMYCNPIFKIKNNGWISQAYPLGRSLRQGCPMSASLFVIVIEILAIMIRKSDNVQGIEIAESEHKIIQYADDATICVRNIISIKHVVDIINEFSRYAGPKLNVRKTKGIWLGSLKDLGIRIFKNITFTGNPVKCLGIYIGHNKKMCEKLNWIQRLERIKKSIAFWKKRHLTVYGRVYVIKTYLMSKMVYPATILTVPEMFKKEVRNMLFEYLWSGKRDKIKRSTVIREFKNGGINMLDIDMHFMSIKAGWVTKLLNYKGKWSTLFYHILAEMGLPRDYIWKMSFRSVETLPQIKWLPVFYQEIIVAFNKCKHIKPLNLANKYEMIEQPLWGNEYFKAKGKCLYMKRWISEGILYVKDLINDRGLIKSDVELYRSLTDKIDIYKEIFIIKGHVLKHIKDFDTSIARHIHINITPYLLYQNKIHVIKQQKSKFFYEILRNKQETKSNMESIYARNFNFENTPTLWRNIYKQKIIDIKIVRLREFNFKLLHNIIPCAKVLCKWNATISETCTYCNIVETTPHMLYECIRIRNIWKLISDTLKCNITWKNVVCGWPAYEHTPKIKTYNVILSIVAMAMFKANSHCKFENKNYGNIDMRHKIIEYLMYNRCLINHTCKQLVVTIDHIITALQE